MISEFTRLYENRADVANEWKKRNGKVIGFFNSLTPEEMIHAAGALPVEIQSIGEDISESRRYLPEFLCPTLKDCLSQALGGKLSYLDGAVMAHLCESVRGFHGVWEKNSGLSKAYFLQIPATSENEALSFFIEELQNFRRFIEDITENRITDDALNKSIQLYNENRNLVKKLYEIRKTSDGVITGADMVDVLNAALIMPREKHNEMLNILINNKKKSVNQDGGALKFYFISNELAEAKIIMSAIEELGGRVISDNLAYGLKYCMEPVVIEGDPMLSLAKHYLSKIPCPGKYPTALLVDNLIASVNQLQCDGIIWSIEKYCDPYLFEFPLLQQAAKENNINLLKIDAEEAVNTGRLKTKLEAFMEMLR
jgi:benzoyl-CoA reductase subunit C